MTNIYVEQAGVSPLHLALYKPPINLEGKAFPKINQLTFLLKLLLKFSKNNYSNINYLITYGNYLIENCYLRPVTSLI